MAAHDTRTMSDPARRSPTRAPEQEDRSRDHREFDVALHTELVSIVLERAMATVRRLVEHASLDTLRKALASETGMEGLAILVGEHKLTVAAASSRALIEHSQGDSAGEKT